jgi:hypothetical protein
VRAVSGRGDLSAETHPFIEGRIRETVWIERGLITKNEATIELNGKPMTTRHYGGPGSLKPKHESKQEIEYQPYRPL